MSAPCAFAATAFDAMVLTLASMMAVAWVTVTFTVLALAGTISNTAPV